MNPVWTDWTKPKQIRAKSWAHYWGTSHVTAQFNTLRPRQNGRHFADDIFKCIFLTENAWILIKIKLKFVSKGSINIPALAQIIAWRRPGDKPLSESMLVRIPRHICVTRPQWVNIGCSSRMAHSHITTQGITMGLQPLESHAFEVLVFYSESPQWYHNTLMTYHVSKLIMLMKIFIHPIWSDDVI